MGADAAVNAVYYNKLAAVRRPRRPGAGDAAAARAEYDADIDVLRLASELVVDDVVAPGELRAELITAVRGRRGQGPLVLTGARHGDHPGLTKSPGWAWNPR